MFVEMMKFVELGICCEIINGSTPSRIIPEYWGGDINWFTPKDLSNLHGKFINESPEKITPKGYSSCSTSMLPANSLLYTSRAPIGHIAINKIECCTNQGFKSLIPKKGVDVNYLYYTLKQFTPQLQNLGNGATFKELSKATISEFKIPLPPLDQQKKIASILDAADTLRQKDKALIAKYDELTQALFLDMFGDPVSNPKGWKKVKMEKLMTIVRGGSPRPIDDYLGGTYPWIKIGDATKGDDIYLNKTKQHITAEGLYKTRLLPKGSLIFANCGVSLGFARIINIEGCIHDGWLAFSDFDEQKLNKIFLLKALNSVTQYFRNTAPDGTQPNLNIAIMKNFEIIIPPILQQEKFEKCLVHLVAQKVKAQESLEKSDELFNSLLQKAFKGELV
jgi:type I restriction enzyme, S subunit